MNPNPRPETDLEKSLRADNAQLRADLAAAREERDATPETFRQAAYMLLATACVVVEIRDSANEARRRAKGHCCDFRSAIDAIYDKAEIELKHLREVGKQYHTWELKEIDRLTARAVEAERVLIKFTNAYDRDCADDYERTLNNLEAAFELACTLLSERSTARVAGLPGDGEGN